MRDYRLPIGASRRLLFTAALGLVAACQAGV